MEKTTKNRLLAIAIPTYNRAEILIENILYMLPEIKKYSVPIYISDDSTNKETEKKLADLKLKYPYIYYWRNDPSLGHDSNCFNTLLMPLEKYIWYLGDSMIIQYGGIQRILEIIEHYHPDFISVNAVSRNFDIRSQLYTDGNLVLRDLGWHLTMTGATIYSKSVIEPKTLPVLSKCKNFPQTAIIFNRFVSKRLCLYWVNERLIFANVNKKSYWEKKVFKIFFTDWIDCINNLDSVYTDENKQTAIISHSRKSGIFDFRGLVSYRYKGFFGVKEYVKYFQMLKKHSKVNFLIIAFIVIIPRFLYSAVLYFFKKVQLFAVNDKL